MDNQQMPSGAYTRKSKVVKWIIMYLIIGVVIYGGLYLAKIKFGYAPIDIWFPGISAFKAIVPEVNAPADEGLVVEGLVSIKGFKFNPATVSVALGDSIIWSNDDAAPHTVTADSGVFNSGDMLTGNTFVMPPLNPGTYTYYCSIHPSMKGTVVVR